MTWNVWGDDGRPILLNGQFGKFLGWTIPTEGKKSKIAPFRTPGAGKGSRNAVKAKTYRVINSRKMRGKARVEFPNGKIHEIGLIQVKSPKTDDCGDTKLRKHKVFPMECAYFTRLHRLQGQSISGKLHIDFKGVGSFEPNCIYVGLSRNRQLPDLSVSNFNSETFSELIAS